VNELLQRKHAWSPSDLERFTSLYRSDHTNEQAESTAQNNLAVTERAAEEASAKLSGSILARYHEEQIWSDKIRRMSTWGTWGLMGVNVLLFLVFQIGVEPWRRRRLVKGFEDKVMEALEKEGLNTERALGEALAMSRDMGYAAKASKDVGTRAMVEETSIVKPATEQKVEQVAAEEVAREQNVPVQAVSAEEPEVQDVKAWIPGLGMYGERAGQMAKKVEDMFSETEVTVRRVDLTKATLEGAFAGVIFVSIFAALIRGR